MTGNHLFTEPSIERGYRLEGGEVQNRRWVSTIKLYPKKLAIATAFWFYTTFYTTLFKAQYNGEIFIVFAAKNTKWDSSLRSE